MPYGATPTGPAESAGAGLEGADQMEGGEGAAGQTGEIHIPSDYLPPGIKEGDTLKCTAMDENGCTFEHMPGATEGEDWEKDFRAEMSPRNPQEEAS